MRITDEKEKNEENKFFLKKIMTQNFLSPGIYDNIYISEVYKALQQNLAIQQTM